MKLKISTLGGAVLVLLVVSTVAAIFTSVRVTNGIHDMDQVWTEFDQNVGAKIMFKQRLNSDLGYGGMIHSFKNYVLRQEGTHADRAQAAIKDARQVISQYRALLITPAESEALDAIAVTVDAYDGALAKALALTAAGRTTADIDRVARIDDDAALKALDVLAKSIAEQEHQTSEMIHGTSDQTAAMGQLGIFLIAGMLAVVVVALGWFLIFRLLRPMRAMTDAMTQLADGRMETAVPAVDRGDEVGDMARALLVFKENSLKIRAMEHSTDRIISTIAETAGQVGSAIAEQAASTSEQAAAVTQTSTSLEEIRRTADSAINQATELSHSAEQAMRQGDTGRRNMEHAMAAMNDIREKVDAIAHTMVVLSEQTRRVGEITDSVSALAQQSKMLAINASIEASKAGEAGKGFAVVAEEVANLAEQSAQATQQVRSVLEQIQGASEKAIFATEEGTKQVSSGVDLIKTVDHDLSGLLGVVEQTASATRNMVNAISQQSAGIQQVANAMTDITSGTNQVAATTGQIRGSVENLNNEVENLARARG